MIVYVEVPAVQRDRIHTVLMDCDDYLALLGRRLSVASHGYAQMCLPGEGRRPSLLHRNILGLKPGDGLIGDHINGDKLDNRRCNLRVVTPSESSANMSAQSRTGYRGVYPNKRKFSAVATVAGKRTHLGVFPTPEEADVAVHAWRLAHMPGYVDRPGARRTRTQLSEGDVA